jgi:hypothetical protein
MKTYIYFSILDPNQEPINKTKTSNLENAILFFAESKKLTTEEFLSLFKVEQFKK